MIKGEMILVKWWDTQGSETWVKESKFLKTMPSIILSPGIFINEDATCLRIAFDLADDGDLIGTAIPKGCIINVHKLNVGEKINAIPE